MSWEMARKSLMSIVFFTLYTSLFFLSQMWLDAILDDADFPRKNTQDNPKIATEDEDMEKVLEPLREVCVHFQAPRDEWWSYSWCHNSMVGQHHFDRETHKAVEHKTIGEYSPSESKPDHQIFREPEARCTVEGKTLHRYAEVNIQCCDDDKSKRPRQLTERQRQAVGANVIHTDVFISRVAESSPCTYFIDVCSVLLCDRGKKATRESTSHTPESSKSSTHSLPGGKSSHRNSAVHNRNSRNTLSSGKSMNRDGDIDVSPEEQLQLVAKIREMFIHSYDAYMSNAYPSGELKPLSCTEGEFDPIKIPLVTLVDSLDTLVVLGNYSEFRRAVYLVQLELSPPTQFAFDFDVNVSVFETTIRILGGLLSAHLMAVDPLLGIYSQDNGGEWVHGNEKGAYDEDDNELTGLSIDPSGDVLDGEDGSTATPSPSEAQVQAPRRSYSTQRIEEPIESRSRVTNNERNQKKQRTRRKERKDWMEEGAAHTYDGHSLLDLATDLGDRLLPAFDTKTGIPMGTVNLRYGVPRGETKIASLAGAGSLLIEFEVLSYLTGNPRYGNVAFLATKALFDRRSELDLLGKHINTETGQWVETISGVGSNSDSFYEYLLKSYWLFQRKELYKMFTDTYRAIKRHVLRSGDWFTEVDMFSGKLTRNRMENLDAFWPGMESTLGFHPQSSSELINFYSVWADMGFLPEEFDYTLFLAGKPPTKAMSTYYPLRPELIESTYHHYRATKDRSWLSAGKLFLRSIEIYTRTECGYAAVTNIGTKELQDSMPSFFLSETLKYLYLLFDENNFMHRRSYIFSTEAHPFDTAQLYFSNLLRKGEDEVSDTTTEEGDTDDKTNITVATAVSSKKSDNTNRMSILNRNQHRSRSKSITGESITNEAVAGSEQKVSSKADALVDECFSLMPLKCRKPWWYDKPSHYDNPYHPSSQLLISDGSSKAGRWSALRTHKASSKHDNRRDHKSKSNGNSNSNRNGNSKSNGNGNTNANSRTNNRNTKSNSNDSSSNNKAEARSLSSTRALMGEGADAQSFLVGRVVKKMEELEESRLNGLDVDAYSEKVRELYLAAELEYGDSVTSLAVNRRRARSVRSSSQSTTSGSLSYRARKAATCYSGDKPNVDSKKSNSPKDGDATDTDKVVTIDMGDPLGKFIVVVYADGFKVQNKLEKNSIEISNVGKSVVLVREAYTDNSRPSRSIIGYQDTKATSTCRVRLVLQTQTMGDEGVERAHTGKEQGGAHTVEGEPEPYVPSPPHVQSKEETVMETSCSLSSYGLQGASVSTKSLLVAPTYAEGQMCKHPAAEGTDGSPKKTWWKWSIPTNAQKDAHDSSSGSANQDIEGKGGNSDSLDNIRGAAVLANRGVCTFEDKSLHAQQAGAEALVVQNSEDNYFVMAGKWEVLEEEAQAEAQADKSFIPDPMELVQKMMSVNDKDGDEQANKLLTRNDHPPTPPSGTPSVESGSGSNSVNGGANGVPITIPTVMVSHSDGEVMRSIIDQCQVMSKKIWEEKKTKLDLNLRVDVASTLHPVLNSEFMGNYGSPKLWMQQNMIFVAGSGAWGILLTAAAENSEWQLYLMNRRDLLNTMRTAPTEMLSAGGYPKATTATVLTNPVEIYSYLLKRRCPNILHTQKIPKDGSTPGHGTKGAWADKNRAPLQEFELLLKKGRGYPVKSRR